MAEIKKKNTGPSKEEETKSADKVSKESNNEIDKQNTSGAQDEDKELLDLLDSALADFGKAGSSVKGGKTNDIRPKEQTKPTPPDSLWDEQFMKLQQLFRDGFGSGDSPMAVEQHSENLQGLAEAASQIFGGGISPDLEFSKAFADVLKWYHENKGNPMMQKSEDAVKELLGEDVEDFTTRSPLFEMMFKGIHPQLKDIADKYPQWLEDNKAKISTEEFERNTKLHETVKSVCSLLEQEQTQESGEGEPLRILNVMMLLIQMEELEPLPTELAPYGIIPPLPPNFEDVNLCSIL